MENKEFDKVKDISLSDELKSSFINYAMSVIVSRALPDVRDGLKPVHRRIVYGMKELGMTSGGAYKKSARLVGDVMGKFHPHGDSSIYDATVRMAQTWSYRYILVNGHGNFGSIDGDGAAAMRYTEVRMGKITQELLREIDKDTVDFQDNYDGSEKEPTVLPSRFPNLLVNGSTGIAVGMATNIPPHNLGEVIDGVIAYVNNNEITIPELMEYIKAPDFPTGGEILGLSGLKEAYETGKGIITIRSKCEIVDYDNGKSAIIIKEIPYQVNKLRLIDKIAELAKEKRVDGITDLRDESNREGIRIVVELRRDVSAEVMLNNLYKYSQLQTTFGINMIALVDNKPERINLKDAIVHYVSHQKNVIVRRTKFDLKKAADRQHIVKGLLIALASIDEVVEIIKSASDDTDAIQKLISNFSLDEIQAKSILDMRLRRLTGLEISKLKEENEFLEEQIAYFNLVLGSVEKQNEILINELTEVKDKFNDKRMSVVNYNDSLDIDDEDLIPVENIIISLTNKGYAKRSTADTYKTQNRGGRGITAQKTYEDDFVEQIIYASTHDNITFFTNTGRVFKLKGYQIPTGSRQAKGLPLVNLLNLEENERINTVLNVTSFTDENNLVFFTKKGVIKRTKVSEYTNIRANGIKAMSLKENDELLAVKMTSGNDLILMATTKGKALCFKEDEARETGRVTSGVRGMDIGDSEVCGVSIVTEETTDILSVTKNGFGKRSTKDQYKLQHRGGKGAKTVEITEKNGPLVSLRSVSEADDIMIITNDGIVIRIDAAKVSQFKKATQGVRLIKLNEGQTVSTIAIIPKETEKDEDFEEVTTETTEE